MWPRTYLPCSTVLLIMDRIIEGRKVEEIPVERPSRFDPAIHVGDQLPACEMVLDIIGDLFTHGRKLKHLVLNDRIVSLLGKLPILGCFVPEIVSPVHVAQSNEPGA
jgi:hypothetical protein